MAVRRAPEAMDIGGQTYTTKRPPMTWPAKCPGYQPILNGSGGGEEPYTDRGQLATIAYGKQRTVDTRTYRRMVDGDDGSSYINAWNETRAYDGWCTAPT